MVKQLTRLEIWKKITKAMPSLKCFSINGHQGYGYVKRDNLVQIARDLGLKDVV